MTPENLDFLNPDLYELETPACFDIMRSDVPELVAEGTVRSGKTIACLLKLLVLHFENEGLKTAIVRDSAVDLHNTIRRDLRFLLRYDFEDPRSQIRAEGGERFHTLHINGGTCVLAGMNRPHAILGTQFDLIFVSQIEELTDEQFQVLKTRCAGSAANWKRNDGKVCYQILGDSNPTYPTHWMYEREKRALMQFIDFTFEDNPHFFRKGKWSKAGGSYVSDLNKSLTGIYHDRFFKGVRVAAEGSVFQIEACHIINELPENFAHYHLYRGMDFGMDDPSTCIWIAWNPQTNDIIVYREYARTHTNILDFGKRILEISDMHPEVIQNTIIDNDLNNHQILQNELKMPCTATRKFSGAIMLGLHLIQHALAQTVMGNPGLRFYEHLVYGSPDPNPKAKKMNLIDEMRALQYHPDKPDTVIDKDDHRIDPLRYFFLWKHGGGVAPHGKPTTVGQLNV